MIRRSAGASRCWCSWAGTSHRCSNWPGNRERWHLIEDASFFVSGLLFWWPVIQPWPSTAKWPRWSMPLYLFLATLPCDVLSAFLAFSDRLVYSVYTLGPRPRPDRAAGSSERRRLDVVLRDIRVRRSRGDHDDQRAVAAARAKRSEHRGESGACTDCHGSPTTGR